MSKKILLGAVVAVLLGLGLFLPVGEESRTVVERVVEPLGSISDPDFSIGAFRLYSQGTTALTQATNTVICSLQSPSSTSTLLHGGIQLTTATSGATNLSISKSSTNATIGTVIASSTVSSGAVKTMIAATTTPVIAADIATGVNNTIFAPNTYFNVAQTGAGILNQSGSCEAVWHVL